MPYLEIIIVDDQVQIAPVGAKGELCTPGYSVMKGCWEDPVKFAQSIRDGENIYPLEIEEFLCRTPKVSEVQACRVWIVLNSGQSMTEDNVKNFCRGQIARYKVRRYEKFVHAVPMTVTAKSQKFVMREIMATGLCLSRSITA